MELLYGTGNPAKLTYMRHGLAGLPFDILSPSDLGLTLFEVAESGNDPLENARLKATAYYKAFGRPLFSCDSGLFIDGLPANRQPGINVRRVGGKRLDDDEMIAHYSGIAREMGGRCTARYHNAICLILGDGKVVESMDADLQSETFYLAVTPHPSRRPGFPLDSLSQRLDTGTYYFDRPKAGEDIIHLGFRKFFEGILTKERIGL